MTELSPERRRLAQLHTRNEQLRTEAAEPNARLRRIDEIIAAAGQAKAHVAALTAEYSRRLEEALANGDTIPAKSHELIRAEASAIVSDEHRAAAERAREHVASEVQQMGAQLGAIGQEIGFATLRVIEEHAEEGLGGAPREAWLACLRAFAPFEGIVETLRARGSADTEAMQVAYRIEQRVRGVTAERVAPDVATARSFIAALAEDATATLCVPMSELEEIFASAVGRASEPLGASLVSGLPEAAASTCEGEDAHPDAFTAIVEPQF